jgi:ribosomal protein L37AE/L43A
MSGKYIVKENLPFGEDYLSYTVSEKATDCYRTFTGTEADCNIEKLNKLLAERYGSVKCPSGAKPVYEIVKITAGRWHCEHCRIDIVQNKTDFPASASSRQTATLWRVFPSGHRQHVQRRHADSGNALSAEAGTTVWAILLPRRLGQNPILL